MARCIAGATDLGEAMVEAGYAVAMPQCSDAYIEAKARARRRAGVIT
ncbi:MAG: hypothetical protein KGL54_01575 [Sphingomonadales bacterium]|nr:hypothetical protein [Sphingomonadales bacterium]